MIRSILVPLDGSDFGERSLPLASRVAKASGASLHLAHVHVPHEPEHLLGNTSFQFEGVDLGEYDERQRVREKEYLSELEVQFGGDGTPVDITLLEAGPVADELSAFADRVDSDMIVITSHAPVGVRRAWVGSVADGILHKTGVPMLVVHPTHYGAAPDAIGQIEHILVPLDGSELAETMLEAASDLARATGARLTLLRVLVSPTLFGTRRLPGATSRPEPDLTIAQDYLDRVAMTLRDDGFEVAVQVEPGDAPAHVISEVADQQGADVIAIATHGYGGLKRTVLGSVADRLLHESRLPLLVMRPTPFD